MKSLLCIYPFCVLPFPLNDFESFGGYVVSAKGRAGKAGSELSDERVETRDGIVASGTGVLKSGILHERVVTQC